MSNLILNPGREIQLLHLQDSKMNEYLSYRLKTNEQDLLVILHQSHGVLIFVPAMKQQYHIAQSL